MNSENIKQAIFQYYNDVIIYSEFRKNEFELTKEKGILREVKHLFKQTLGNLISYYKWGDDELQRLMEICDKFKPLKVKGNKESIFDNKWDYCPDYFYNKYLDYVKTGEYPYLSNIEMFIEKDLSILDETTKKNLHTIIYNCSQRYRQEQGGRQ